MRLAYDANPGPNDQWQSVYVKLGNCFAEIPLQQLTETEPLFALPDYGLEFTGERTYSHESDRASPGFCPEL